MNVWTIVALVVGLLVITGVVVSNFGAAQETKKIEEKQCGNQCTPEENCGLEACGAVYGKACGCRG